MSSTTVLCEVSEEEIARLRGCTSTYDKKWAKEYLNVGVEHDFKTAFETLDTLRSLDSNKFNDVYRSLKGLNDSFDRARQAHEALMLFDKLKEIPVND